MGGVGLEGSGVECTGSGGESDVTRASKREG